MNIEAFDPKLIYWKKGNCHLLLENARILLWIHLKRLKVKDSLKKNFWPLINLTDKCIYVQKGDENAYTAQERLTDLWLLHLRLLPLQNAIRQTKKKLKIPYHKIHFSVKKYLQFFKILEFSCQLIVLSLAWWLKILFKKTLIIFKVFDCIFCVVSPCLIKHMNVKFQSFSWRVVCILLDIRQNFAISRLAVVCTKYLSEMIEIGN